MGDRVAHGIPENGGQTVKRADDALHEAFFRPMQDQIHRATGAISEARALAYAVLDPSADRDLLEQVANLWLDKYGRDLCREANQ